MKHMEYSKTTEIPKILGVDFDDTLFFESWPHNYDKPNWRVIEYVKEKQNNGWYIVLVTCRTKPEHLNGAILAADSVGLRFDAINQNHPDMISRFGDCRKIFCNEYIDDKNSLIGLKVSGTITTSSNISSGDAAGTNAAGGITDGVITIPFQTNLPQDYCACINSGVIPGVIPQVDDRKRNRQMPTVYISGKMRGLENHGRDKFNAAEELLNTFGVVVINPSKLPDGLPTEKYMPLCIDMLEASDCIYMLDNWRDSLGAIAEHSYAECQNKLILYENGPEGGNQQWS